MRMWCNFWALNGYTHLDPSYGILPNCGCIFQSMGTNTHSMAYNQVLSASLVPIAWKISLIIIHMVSLLRSIPFICNHRRYPLLHYLYNKFLIDMHVSLLNQWDFHLQDQTTIIFRSFLEASLPTSDPSLHGFGYISQWISLKGSLIIVGI